MFANAFIIFHVLLFFVSSVSAQSGALSGQGKMPNTVYSVSGPHGAKAVNGQKGAMNNGHGRNGSDGSPAQPPSPGKAAGEIYMSLSKSSSGKVHLKGQMTVPVYDVERTNRVEKQDFEAEKIDTTIDLGWGNKLELLARGGDGQDGGRGGDGVDGDRGSRGRDATTGSSGTDGGPGGDGGDAGAGTNGSDSGKGGRIHVSVSSEETDLLLLIGPIDINAGNPGAVGQHGNPGHGGPGGSGGSSYSWTSQSCSGFGKNRSCSTRYHSNPGGSNGQPGSRGSIPTTPLKPGARSENGSYTITVNSPEGSKTYPNRYTLRVESFVIESEDGDGIIEPGELVTVSQIVLGNSGAMPMPVLPVDIRLTGTGFQQESENLRMTGALPVGSKTELEGVLKFRVIDTQPVGREARNIKVETVSPIGRQTGVERDHEESPTMKEFEVTYPIEITPIRVPKSLAPGQTAKLTWKVRNISGRSFGATSDLKRAIATKLNVNAKAVRATTMIYRDSHGNEVSLGKGFMQAIDLLAAGEERIIEGFVTIHPDAELYAKAGLVAGLDIGERQDRAFLRNVQTNTLTINVSQVFKKTKGSDVLLVTNSSSQTEEVIAWTKAFAKLGFQADVWDLSYEGFLDLTRPLASHSDTPLAQLYKDGLVIVLDYDLPSDTQTAAVRPYQLLKRSQILEALRKSNVNFLFVSNDRILDNALVNELAVNTPVKNQKLEMFPKTGFPRANSTEQIVAYYSETSQAEVQAVSMELVEESWFEPSENTLIKRVTKLSRRLQKLFPSENFLVTYEYDGSKVNDPSDWFRKHYRVGQITVYPGLSRNKGGIYRVQPKGFDIQSSDYILSRANMRTLMQALPMREKAKNWISALKNKNTQTAALAADAIFLEIWDEQKAILDRWGNGKAEDQLKGLRQLLQQLSEAKIKLQSPTLDPNGMGDHFLELMARLSYSAAVMQEENGRYFGWFDGELQDAVNLQIEENIKQVFGENLPSDNSIKAFFGISKSHAADIAEQQSALESFSTKKERLVENSQDDQEPLYWLLGDHSVRNLYGIQSSVFESTQVVRASDVKSALILEGQDIQLRQQFEQTRRHENEDLMPEAINN